MMAHLVPEAALAMASDALAGSLAPRGTPAAEVSRAAAALEGAVNMLEAVAPPLIELAQLSQPAQVSVKGPRSELRPIRNPCLMSFCRGAILKRGHSLSDRSYSF